MEHPPIVERPPIPVCFPVILRYNPYSPVQPRYTASSHLSPVVLSRTGGLRGLPPIGWLTRYGPHRPVPFCCSGFGLVALVRTRGLAGRGSIGARARPSRPGFDWCAHFGTPQPDWSDSLCSDRGLLPGRLGVAAQLKIGEKGYGLLYSCTHSRSSSYWGGRTGFPWAQNKFWNNPASSSRDNKGGSSSCWGCRIGVLWA